MKLIAATLLFFLNFTYSSGQQLKFGLKPPALDQKDKRKLWATQYYVYQMNSTGNIPFVLSDGSSTNLFADTCAFCDAALEGTAFVKDNSGNVTVLNFAKVGNKQFVDCRKCWKYKNSKLPVEDWGKVVWSRVTGLGKGVNNYNLIPYRTIAVDKSIIPIGTVLFIPSIQGTKIKLSDGTIVEHDGYFFAGDVGKGIIGNHIDIFTGLETGNPFPKTIYSKATGTFDAYIVRNNQIISNLNQIHL